MFWTLVAKPFSLRLSHPLRVRQNLGNAEIGDLGSSSAVQQDVGTFEVAMNHILGVEISQPTANVGDKLLDYFFRY